MMTDCSQLAEQLISLKARNQEWAEAPVNIGTDAQGDARAAELTRLVDGARLAEKLGLECHAGHGLNYETVEDVAAIQTIVELNIGHFLVGEAIFVGLEQSIQHMRQLMDIGRGSA